MKKKIKQSKDPLIKELRAKKEPYYQALADSIESSQKVMYLHMAMTVLWFILALIFMVIAGSENYSYILYACLGIISAYQIDNQNERTERLRDKAVNQLCIDDLFKANKDIRDNETELCNLIEAMARKMEEHCKKTKPTRRRHIKVEGEGEEC